MQKRFCSSAWIRPRKRWAIYCRDGFRCVYCGVKPEYLQLDHLFPRASRWRDNHHTRLVTCCLECNTEKAVTPLAEWLRHLRLNKGVDLQEFYRRLQVARYVPLNRRAGDRALAAHRARYSGPLPDLPVDFPQTPDGIPL